MKQSIKSFFLILLSLFALNSCSSVDDSLVPEEENANSKNTPNQFEVPDLGLKAMASNGKFKLYFDNSELTITKEEYELFFHKIQQAKDQQNQKFILDPAIQTFVKIAENQFTLTPTSTSIFHKYTPSPNYAQKIDIDEVYIPVGFLTNLHGLHLKLKDRKKSKGLVFFFHGKTTNLTYYQKIIEQYTNYNYDVFSIDYRQFGKSGGNLMLADKEVINDDMQKVYEYLLKQYDPKKIVVFGFSLGSGIASQFVATTNKKPKALVLLSPYYSIYDNMEYFVEAGYLTSVVKDLWPTINKVVNQENAQKYMSYNFESAKYMNSFNIPTYIYHGTKDTTTPISHAERLAKLNKNVKFTKVEGALHDDTTNLNFSHILK